MREVEQAVEDRCTAITPDARQRALRIELERLDELSRQSTATASCIDGVFIEDVYNRHVNGCTRPCMIGCGRVQNELDNRLQSRQPVPSFLSHHRGAVHPLSQQIEELRTGIFGF